MKEQENESDKSERKTKTNKRSCTIKINIINRIQFKK